MIGLDGDPFEVGEEIRATGVFDRTRKLGVIFELQKIDIVEEASHLRH